MTVPGLNFFTGVDELFGAGVAGKGFALNLAGLTDVRLQIPANGEIRVADPAEKEQLLALSRKPVLPAYPSLVRGAMSSRTWLYPDSWPLRTMGRSDLGIFVGHIFFEFDRLQPEELKWIDAVDLMTTGSEWTTRILRDYGLERVATLYQGVETDLFRPATNPRPPEWQDRFVVFNGGKMEYRKGTDLVIAAFARFCRKYPEALLVINAYNRWPETQLGLAESPHFEFGLVEDYPRDLEALLVHNGIPRENFQVMPPTSRQEMARTMQNSDCGLFPIRSEGGTNHFLMEYMACGKAAIATWNTGLKEILQPNQNGLGLEARHAVTVSLIEPMPDRGLWHEPDVDEIVAALERLYGDRALAARLGARAAVDLDFFSWPRRARALLDLIEEYQPFCQ